MGMKYELVKDISIDYKNHTLYKIKALKDFGKVKKDDLGGYVESEKNLSQKGNCWISGIAKVYDNAKVYGSAEVSSRAKVYGSARVFGDAEVYGNAKVHGNAKVYDSAEITHDAQIKSSYDYLVFKNTWSSGRNFTYTKSNKMWKVGCFYGTGEELVVKAYKDSKESGDKYKLYVDLVNNL